MQVLSESNKELITSVNEQIIKGEKSILNNEVKQYIHLLIKNQAPESFSPDTLEVMQCLLKQNPEEVMKSFASFTINNNSVHKNNRDFIINAALQYPLLGSSKEIIRENILEVDSVENEQTKKDLWEVYTETATQKEILQLIPNLTGYSQMTCYKKHNQKNPKQFVDLVNSVTSSLKDLNPNEFSSLLKSISTILSFSTLENFLKNNEDENNKKMAQSLKELRECVKNHLFNYIQNNPKDALKTLEIIKIVDNFVSLDVSSTHWFDYYLDLNSVSSEKYPVTKFKEFREALSTKIINQFQKSFLAQYSNNPLSFFELKQNERTGKDEWVVPFEKGDLYKFENTDKFLSKFLLDNLEVIKEKANGISLSFQYANFSGLDLSPYNLEGINFKNSNFSEAILPKDLSRINFQGANLTGTDFSKVDILPTSLDAFQRAVLNKAKFSTHDLSNFNFESTHLVGADFSEVIALPTNPNAFNNAYLSEVDFSNCDLSIFNFQNGNLHTVDFSNVKALPSSPDAFQGANLQGSDFTDCDLSNLSFQNCKLGGTVFSKVKTLPTTLDAFQGAHLKDSSSNLYVDFSNLDLSSYSFAGIDFENIDLGNKNFSNTIFPHKLSSYVDLKDSKSLIQFFTKLLEVESKYDSYRQLFALTKLDTSGLEKAISTLITNYIESDSPEQNTISLLEKLYNSSIKGVSGKESLFKIGFISSLSKQFLNQDTNSLSSLIKILLTHSIKSKLTYQKQFPQIGKSLSSLKKTSSNNPIKLLAGIIQNSNRQEREIFISSIQAISKLQFEDRNRWWVLLTNQIQSQQQKEILYSLQNIKLAGDLSSNSQELLTEFLSSTQLDTQLNSLVYNSGNAQLLFQVFAGNLPLLSVEHLQLIDNHFDLNVNSTDETSLRSGIPALMNKKIKSNFIKPEEMIEFMNKFNENNPNDKIIIQEKQKAKLLKENLAFMLRQIQNEVFNKALGSVNYISKDTQERIKNTQDPNLMKKKIILINYFQKSLASSPKVADKIFLILNTLLDANKELTRQNIHHIDKLLLEDFDLRFKDNHGFSWVDTMRTLHPNIKTENIRAPFELKFGQYTIKLANTLGYLFNGVDVNSFMCTALGNFNQHLQIGMTSNMNNVFFEIYSNSGEKLSGFDGRILLDGSIVLSSSHQYTYGNNKSQLLSGSFEQKLINSYASHLGINYVTLPSNIQTADMNTQSLSGVQAYMESGVVYKPQ